jgi:hypothetical protein
MARVCLRLLKALVKGLLPCLLLSHALFGQVAPLHTTEQLAAPAAASVAGVYPADDGDGWSNDRPGDVTCCGVTSGTAAHPRAPHTPATADPPSLSPSLFADSAALAGLASSAAPYTLAGPFKPQIPTPLRSALQSWLI